VKKKIKTRSLVVMIAMVSIAVLILLTTHHNVKTFRGASGEIVSVVISNPGFMTGSSLEVGLFVFLGVFIASFFSLDIKEIMHVHFSIKHPFVRVSVKSALKNTGISLLLIALLILTVDSIYNSPYKTEMSMRTNSGKELVVRSSYLLPKNARIETFQLDAGDSLKCIHG
jgi:hypothetical protein